MMRRAGGGSLTQINWGFVESEAEKAMRVAAESLSGVRAVNCNLAARRIEGWA